MQVVITVEDRHQLDELRFEVRAKNTKRDFGPSFRAPAKLCHHASTHTGLVTVVDPDGNGDSAFFNLDRAIRLLLTLVVGSRSQPGLGKSDNLLRTHPR